MCFLSFFFNDTATTEIYTLSLHDALPIFQRLRRGSLVHRKGLLVHEQEAAQVRRLGQQGHAGLDERHQPLDGDRKSTRLNLQSRQYLVCRLLLEKKKHISTDNTSEAHSPQ